jgi:putative addiction module antidote
VVQQRLRLAGGREWRYNGRMNVTLKITKIGNSAAVILTKEVLAQLRAEVGDTIHLTQSPEGWHLTPYDPEFERQMDLAERIMRDDRDILKVLAK